MLAIPHIVVGPLLVIPIGERLGGAGVTAFPVLRGSRSPDGTSGLVFATKVRKRPNACHRFCSVLGTWGSLFFFPEIKTSIQGWATASTLLLLLFSFSVPSAAVSWSPVNIGWEGQVVSFPTFYRLFLILQILGTFSVYVHPRNNSRPGIAFSSTLPGSLAFLVPLPYRGLFLALDSLDMTTRLSINNGLVYHI